jgi:hypothetical protein
MQRWKGAKMLYQIMKPEFSLLLLLYGLGAMISAMIFVYGFHTYQPLRYKKGLITASGLFCASFILMFIRVTQPFEKAADILLFVSAALALTAFISAVITVFFYLAEKKDTASLPAINILHVIEDYVLIVDTDNKVVFSTCPDDLKWLVLNKKEDRTTEIYNEGMYYSASFSPIIKKNTVIGYIGIIGNITAEKVLIDELSEQNERLKQINQMLDTQVSIDDALLLAKNQQRVSVEIQQKIGKRMTEVTGLIDKMEAEANKTEQCNNLDILSEYLRSILQDIRKVVN